MYMIGIFFGGELGLVWVVVYCVYQYISICSILLYLFLCVCQEMRQKCSQDPGVRTKRRILGNRYSLQGSRQEHSALCYFMFQLLAYPC